jgi:NADPH:quinone reductase-like Zn-dependent oxidoreductase
MKAALYRRYGPAETVAVEDVPEPTPGDAEVLVEIHASTVTTADWRLRAAAFPGVLWLPGRAMTGLFRPRRPILGGDFSGRVAAVGPGVTRFAVGDEVFGFAGHGAHAERLVMSETGAIAPKPAQLAHAEAAAVPFGGLAALVFLRDFAKLKAGQRVLILGATGGVGVFAVQLARQFGARVTATASAGKAELVRSLGAEAVIDHHHEDFAESGETFDVVLDTVGASDFARARRALSPSGVYVPLDIGLREIFWKLATIRGKGRRIEIGVSSDTAADLGFLAGLLEDGAVRPVIDSTFPLNRIVDAHRRVESRRKTGGVVIYMLGEVAQDLGSHA